MTKRGKKTSLVSYVTMQFQLVQVKIKRGLLRTSLMSSCSLVFRKHIKSDECKFKRFLNCFIYSRNAVRFFLIYA